MEKKARQWPSMVPASRFLPELMLRLPSMTQKCKPGYTLSSPSCLGQSVSPWHREVTSTGLILSHAPAPQLPQNTNSSVSYTDQSVLSTCSSKQRDRQKVPTIRLVSINTLIAHRLSVKTRDSTRAECENTWRGRGSRGLTTTWPSDPSLSLLDICCAEIPAKFLLDYGHCCILIT